MLAVAVTNASSAWHLSTLTLAAGTTLDVAPSGLWGRYCDIPGFNAATISNAFTSVAAATAFFAGYAPTLTANSHEAGDGFDFGDSTKGTIAFPGVFRPARGNYAVIWRGKIRIASPGPYTFTTTSDDNSMLFIDGAPVVDNNGSHGYISKSGALPLTAGLHDIVILYAQGGGGYGIRADILFPGAATAVPIPNAILVAAPEDVPAYTLTVDHIRVIGASGAGTLSLSGGALRFGALSVDLGTRLAVTGSSAALSTPVLPVAISAPVPYGVTVVGDFSQSGGLNLSGAALQLSGSDGILRYNATTRHLQIGRSSGTLLLLR
ncbi:MAG: hypothetical protein LBW77_05125 [Verrucomicrobiota bacterium]|nr:hypothetical protein [Verrucomicrobiota bacterium]